MYSEINNTTVVGLGFPLSLRKHYKNKKQGVSSFAESYGASYWARNLDGFFVEMHLMSVALCLESICQASQALLNCIAAKNLES